MNNLKNWLKYNKWRQNDMNKIYKFDELLPEAQQRAIDDYRNALIADGVPTNEVNDDWALREDLIRYQLQYLVNGERYEK